VIAYMRGNLLFVFNFDGQRSFTEYGFLCPKGQYELVLDTDAPQYGGFGFVDPNADYETNYDPLYEGDGKGWLKLYIPARSALVFRKKN